MTYYFYDVGHDSPILDFFVLDRETYINFSFRDTSNYFDLDVEFTGVLR